MLVSSRHKIRARAGSATNAWTIISVYILIFVKSLGLPSEDIVVSFPTQNQQSSYVAMCTCVKDDREALREWVEYHHCIGVEKFYVYDDNSAQPLLGAIQDFVDKGVVEYRYMSQGKPSQIFAYNDCLQRHRSEHKWIMSFDIDEFVVLNEKSGLPFTLFGTISDRTNSFADFLRDYEDVGGLAIQWKIFGSAGHVSKPSGGMMRNFDMCLLDNTKSNDGYGIKTVANTAFAAKWVSTHVVMYFDSEHFTVDPDRREHQRSTRMELVQPDGETVLSVRQDRIQLNHYTVRSWEQFKAKMKLGAGDGGHRDEHYFERVDKGAKDKCMEGFRVATRCLGTLE